MKEFLIRNKIYLLGGIFGAIGGYIYWANVGCETGTCRLKSSPVATILFGTIIGLLLSDWTRSFISRKK